MAKYKKMMPPRRTSIRGQDHLLAYITPEEAQMLMDQGGAGKPGPMGVPAFFTAQDDDAGFDDDTGASDFSPSDIGISGEDTSEGSPSMGMSPGRSQAQFGTPEFAGKTEQQAINILSGGGGSDTARAIQQNIATQQANEIAALQQLNRDLRNLSRREMQYKQMMSNPLLRVPGYLGLQNIRNIASAAIGAPPNILGGMGLGGLGIGGFKIGDRVSPEFGGLPPSELAALQSRAIRGPVGTDPFGRPQEGIVGFRDAYGNVQFGRDPNEQYDMSEGQEIKPVDEEGKCPEGYIFDEDLQACRLDTGASAGAVGSVVPPAPGGYARMGLLDVAPTGLPQFQQTYGAGFGTPADFGAANLAFRQRGATYPEFYQNPPQLSGYTLLS